MITLGLGQDGYCPIPTDAAFRMDVAALRRQIERDEADGIVPVAVVATLGTTSTTSLDPVRDIAGLCEDHGIWLHVDAAYGGAAAVVPELRSLLDGWDLADSVVINPHKWLFTPIDCSLLYCRRPDELVRAFSIVPEYLSSPQAGGERNLMDYGVALGRRFRSLKLWFVLRYFGRAGIVEGIRAHVALARELADWIDEADGWERMAPAPLSTVVFRFALPGLSDEDVDLLNHRILQRVNASGETFLIHTVLRGRVVLRIAIGNLKTTRRHVARAWELLREAAAAEVLAVQESRPPGRVRATGPTPGPAPP